MAAKHARSSLVRPLEMADVIRRLYGKDLKFKAIYHLKINFVPASIGILTRDHITAL